MRNGWEYIVNTINNLVVFRQYQHALRNALGESAGFDKNNIMMVGPSGSGKSYIIKKVSELLNVPFVSVDATAMTAAGYTGVPVLVEK